MSNLHQILIKIIKMSTNEEEKNGSKLNSCFFSKKFKINVRFSKGEKTIERSGKIVKICQKLPLNDF